MNSFHWLIEIATIEVAVDDLVHLMKLSCRLDRSEYQTRAPRREQVVKWR